MRSSYTGGLGGREDGDLVRWTLDIDQETRDIQTYGGPRQVVVTGVSAELTLYDINKAESEAVIQLINEMRSASLGVVIEPGRYPSIGDRFRGLEFE